MTPRIFDAHCDTILKIVDDGADILDPGCDAHITAPAMLEAGIGCQVFACFVSRKHWAGDAAERALTLLEAARALDGQGPFVLPGTRQELLDLAGPMLVILLVQTVVMALFAYFITFRLMGKNYDAAIIAGGHCGFGLGATPTAVANMESLVARFGPSPQAFLVVPLAGAFFLDVVNALVIQLYMAMPFVK